MNNCTILATLEQTLGSDIFRKSPRISNLLRSFADELLCKNASGFEIDNVTEDGEPVVEHRCKIGTSRHFRIDTIRLQKALHRYGKMHPNCPARFQLDTHNRRPVLSIRASLLPHRQTQHKNGQRLQLNQLLLHHCA